MSETASNADIDEESLWDEMLGDVNRPRAETVELFLSAQTRLAEAEARFQEKVDGVREAWKVNSDFVFELVADVHNEQHQKIEHIDSYVRLKMVETDMREKDLARKLEEAERKRQAYFSTLLGKVTSKASKFMGLVRSNNAK
jgi:hypothetical protein